MEDTLSVIPHHAFLVGGNVSGREQLVAHGGVFGIVVVKLVGGHYFRDGEHADAAINGGHAAGQLATSHKLLDHQLVVVFESLGKGPGHLFAVMDLGDAHAGAGVASLHKTGIAAHALDAVVVNRVVMIEMQGW